MNINCSRLQWTITHHDLTVVLLTRKIDREFLSIVSPTAWRENYVEETKLYMFNHEFRDFRAFRGSVPQLITPDQLALQFLADLDSRSSCNDEQYRLDGLRCRASYPPELLFGRLWEQRHVIRNGGSVCIWRPRLMWCSGEEPGYRVLADLTPGYSPVDL